MSAVPPSAYRAVVFDYGGVLITPITERIERVAARHGVDVLTMLGVLMGPRESSSDHPWHRAERGELPFADIQANLGPYAEAAGLTLHGDEIAAITAPGAHRYHPEMLERVARLRAEGYVTGLLTNTFAEYRPTLEAELDLSLFDVVVDSSEVGARKPEPEIYRRTTEMVGVAPEQLVYLDDFVWNVVGARRAGWAVIHVTSPQQALRELDELLARG